MSDIMLNNRTPDTSASTSHIMNTAELTTNTESVQLITDTEQMLTQNSITLSIPIHLGIDAIKSSKNSQPHDTGNTNQLTSLLNDSNVIIPPADGNYHKMSH